ncbi:radical SAM protein [Pseudobutyrivibrio ruminis]|uniref:radical SAM protein n=1 Tax=Pseudobutyrivibrio ruminis TaxID=46206 RepID=UPI00051BD5E2|nr:radical SAM protein [Pseudobutyrivibrio ruminis]
MRWTNRGKQYKEISDHLSKRKKICLYGNESSREFFLLNICHPFLRKAVDCYITIDITAEEKDVYPYPIYSDDILFSQHDVSHIIVVTQMDEYRNKMVERLNRAGYTHGWDYFLYNDSFWGDIYGLNHPFLPLFSLYAMNKVYTTSGCIVPDTTCNLNCRDCLNFTPYLKKHITYDYDCIRKDADLYFKWIDYSERFQVSGGEPLLYRDFNKVIKYIGENYRNQIGVYETVFNGTVVPSDETCELIKKYDMTVYLDNYIDSIKKQANQREKIIQKFEKYQIKWIDNTVEEWFSLDIENTDNSWMNENELTHYFDSCNNPWHAYDGGKLYSCNFARFASKAGLYDESQNDYFNLSKMTDERRGELVEFMLGYTTKGYVDFCKNCSGWGPSNKNRVPVAVQLENNT